MHQPIVLQVLSFICRKQQCFVEEEVTTGTNPWRLVMRGTLPRATRAVSLTGPNSSRWSVMEG
jgi:hypothetical protein